MLYFIASLAIQDPVKRFIATKYLIKNGLGEKSIFCDKEAAPDRFKIGESIIKI